MKAVEMIPVTLTLYPNNVGIGYVVCQGPKEIWDYGITKITPLTEGRVLKRTRELLEHAKPQLVLLRNPDAPQHAWSNRKVKLIERIRKEAELQGCETFWYTRDQIKDVFEQFGTKCKYGISNWLSKHYPFLKARKPAYRTKAMNEDYHMGVFDAFALMVTHEYLEG